MPLLFFFLQIEIQLLLPTRAVQRILGSFHVLLLGLVTERQYFLNLIWGSGKELVKVQPRMFVDLGGTVPNKALLTR